MIRYSIISLLIISFSLWSCSDSGVNTSTDSSTMNISYPYRYVSTKREVRENDGSYNEMILYVCGKHPNIDTLKMFCKSKKDSISDGYFHILIFFDSPKHAVFSKYPVTAIYGDEEKPLRHIKAEYDYNIINGYSKLDVYKENAYVSDAVEYDIN